MAVPTCAHCGNASFELQEAPDIEGANFTLVVVRCSGCGVPIGVLEKANVGALLEEQTKRVLEIGTPIASLADRLGKIEALLAAKPAKQAKKKAAA